MPRANRHFLPGYVWHITHRCHKKNLLLKFARDRHNYLRWVFEAKKRFGLSVLNYIVTCNHADSMQLIAGRSGQEYNQRKGATAHSGKTVIMPLQSKLGSICTVALFTST